MASVSTYLNFARETEAAFQYYKSVFGGEFKSVMRFGEMPAQPGQPPIADGDRNLIMHIALPITAGHLLMGTDAPETMGFKVTQGNNVYINLDLDTRGETERLFNALAAGGKVEMQLQDMFWGDYFGSLTDKFGIQWMLTCAKKT